MDKCVFDSCCGCIGLHTGTKILGIITVILKISSLGAVGVLLYMSFLYHAFGGRQEVLIEILFAMPVISAVVIILQLVFLIIFIVRLFKNHIDNIGKLYITKVNHQK